jgi:hypothetical protein
MVHVMASPVTPGQSGAIRIYLGDAAVANREVWFEQMVPLEGLDRQVPLEGHEWLRIWNPFIEDVAGVATIRNNLLSAEKGTAADMHLLLRFFQEE